MSGMRTTVSRSNALTLLAVTAWVVMVANQLAAAPADGALFGDWTARCEPQQETQEQCFILQELLTKDGGQRVLRIVVSYLPGAEAPVMLVTLPLGIFLPPGARLYIDGASEPIRFPIQTCDPSGCRAGLKLTPERLHLFADSAQASVTFYDKERQPIAVPLSLQGFTKGMESLR